MAFTKEQIAEFLAKKTLQYFNNPEDSINPYQKEISGGNINLNRDPNNPLVVYKSDIKANIEEYVDIVVMETIYSGSYDSSIDDGNVIDIDSVADFNTFALNYLEDPPNIGQFVEFETSQSIIDPNLAGEVLDTGIYELLPPQTDRQEEIDNWFIKFYDLIDDYDILSFIEEPPGSGNIVGSEDWDDIAEVPNSTSASIVRIDEDAPEGNINEGQTLEFLRNYLDNYLEDVDSQTEIDLTDGRPEYEPISDGYLKFRGLNQSILIRNDEGNEIDFAYDSDGNGIPNYLETGLTITIWVKFLNKVNSGTLFNYGNPFRSNNPHGFRLETFILKKGDVNSDAYPQFFQTSDYERFIRLVVRESTGKMRHSHMGAHDTPDTVPTIESMIESDDTRLYEYTHVPIDLTEWFFVVANYNVDINEDGSTTSVTDPYFWKWNIANSDGSGGYTANSGYGSKCKVEVISKSDLLLARGYKS